MQSTTHRIVAHNFDTKDGFVRSARQSMLRIAEDGAHWAGDSILGVWLDASRKGVSMRLLRDSEMNLGQSFAWRPLRAFPLDRVALEGVDWLVGELQGEGV